MEIRLLAKPTGEISPADTWFGLKQHQSPAKSPCADVSNRTEPPASLESSALPRLGAGLI